MSGQKPREIAARLLQPQGAQAEYIERRLETELRALTPRDRGLCQELVCGVVRWKATLDWLIARKTKNRTQKTALQTLLRLGLYQMFWLDRIPDHAVVNETVELARQSGFGPQASFVNALLRGYTREREETRKLLDGLKTNQPALGHSHPGPHDQATTNHPRGRSAQPDSSSARLSLPHALPQTLRPL